MKKIRQKLLFLVVVIATLLISVAGYCHEPQVGEEGKLTFSGYLNVEANYSHLSNEDGTNDESNDIYVDELGLAFSAGLANNISATALILYEENSDDSLVTIDEAYLSYEKDSFYGKAGKFYLPLWCDETNFIVDSYTHDLGETRETAIALGADVSIASFEVGAFNGDSDKISDEEKDKADDFFAMLEITPIGKGEEGEEEGKGGEGKGDMKIAVRVAYQSDITDTDAELLADEEGYEKRVGGYSVCFSAVAKTGSVIAEYVSATDEIEEIGAKPNALNVEVATTVVEDWLFGVKYEATEDFVSLVEDGDQKITRLGVVAGYSLSEKATIKLEYLRDKDDSDNHADIVTTQLGLEF